MYVRLTLIELLTVLLLDQCKSANILGIVSTPSYSHQIVFRPLWKELSLRGHHVTVLTTDPMNDSALTNLTEIDLHSSYDVWTSSGVVKIASENNLNPFKVLDKFLEVIVGITVDQLEHPEVQKLINDREVKFDLVLVEPIMPFGVAFSERFNCPYIVINSLEPQSYYHTIIGNPVHPILYPDVMLPFAAPLAFTDRIIAAVFWTINKIVEQRYLLTQTNLIRKYFGENMPTFEEILAKASLLFMNANAAFSDTRPLTPATVIISGGTHFEQPKPLPQGIKEFLDNSTNGAIYFSLGSNVKIADIPVDRRNIILEALGELPYNVLWKFEADNLLKKPDNVLIAKWFPQQDILRHPNIKVFITQGGLQSAEEALFANVPLVGMPFFGDQMRNIDRIVDSGLGVSIDKNNFDKESFKQAILEVANNPTYRNTAREVKQLSADRPMTGIEEALWWTEYMLRHNDTRHLKSSYFNEPLYQYLLLDVISFLLIVTSIVTYLVYRIARYMSMIMYRNLIVKQKIS